MEAEHSEDVSESQMKCLCQFIDKEKKITKYQITGDLRQYQGKDTRTIMPLNLTEDNTAHPRKYKSFKDNELV